MDAFTQQRDAILLEAIADWRASYGHESHGRNRRYAMRLLAAERARRNWRRAELLAAHSRNIRRAA